MGKKSQVQLLIASWPPCFWQLRLLFYLNSKTIITGEQNPRSPHFFDRQAAQISRQNHLDWWGKHKLPKSKRKNGQVRFPTPLLSTTILTSF